MSVDFVYVPGGVLARQDPPPPSARSGEETDTNWKLIAGQLKADPGHWYHLTIGSHALAQYSKIKPGKTGNWRPAGAFEACTRQIDGVVHLYGRYIGPDS